MQTKAVGERRREALMTHFDADEALAAMALFAIGLRQFVGNGTTSGFGLAFLLVPIWIGAVRFYRGAQWVLLIGLAAAVWGYLLSGRSLIGHTVSPSNQRSSTILVLGTVACIGVVLWARRIMPMSRIGLYYGLGMSAGALVGFAPAGGNAWKFAWALPVAVVSLSAASRAGRRLVEVATLLVLALVSIVFDSRSFFATFLLAAVLVIWQLRPVDLSGRASWIWTASFMAGIAGAVYYLGTTLLVSGYLGADAQQRSIAQIQTSGSLILGGRPELAATWALLQDRPGGFGAGVVANPTDILVAKSGMKSIDYDPNNGYVERFMFGGGHIELHSVLGDLWATYGLVGLAFGGVLIAAMVRGLAEALSRREASGALIYLACTTLWNMFFSPLYASQPALILTLGLVLTLAPGASDTLGASGRAGRPLDGSTRRKPRVVSARTDRLTGVSRRSRPAVT